MILRFLDEEAICRVTPLVSRLWLRLSRSIKPACIVVVWHSSWSSELLDMKLLALQDNATYFRCFITERFVAGHYKGRRLYGALECLQTRIREQELDVYSDDQNHNTRNHFKTGRNGKPFGTLRSLYLHFGPQALAAVDRFPFPSSLNKLSIIGVRSGQPLEMDWIFDRCPFLEELCIEGHASNWRSVRLSWNKHNERCLGRLRFLTLKSIHILRSDLEYLCSISPQLTDVKFFGVSTEPDHESQDGLYKSLQTLQMAPRSTSLLPLSGVMPQRQLKQWLAQSWYAWLNISLYVPSTTLSLLRELVHCPSQLTSLELVPQPRLGLPSRRLGTLSDQTLVYHQLHTLLCTSSSLVHLQRLRTVILLEDIDLFGRRGFVDEDVALDKATYPKTNNPTTHSGIWLCRRLKSLRVEVQREKESLVASSAVHSRIVFGYISGVCPYLESLEIDVPYADSTADILEATFYLRLSMKLQGGLCLLAKLDRLRRLRISSERGLWIFDCEDYEVNWISCSPYHRINRMFRHWTLSRWKKMREHEKQQEEARLEAAKEERVSESLTEPKVEVAQMARTTSTVVGAPEVNPAQHGHVGDVDGWNSAMNLGGDEDEAQSWFHHIGLWDSAMTTGPATASQDATDQNVIDHPAASDLEFVEADPEEDISERKGPFVPEPIPVECLPGVQQVLGDLQYLGLLRDVEVMIRWMQSDNFHPLPELKRLSLGFETLQRPKDEMRRLFPLSIDPHSA
ncbi:hypothetical protein EC957_010577 [Mortierella hygrophila]|uniref:Uncharacterized protein n=1 Tax=Mortierella hygrophila TaxID=979708 RepID=A0A9P6F9V2_9FUNG|nr:hypothetical protein EC957_010577 [Mortierella hygrophila]